MAQRICYDALRIEWKRGTDLGKRSSALPSHSEQDLTGRLIGSFKSMISAGNFEPGAKLPPERELSKLLGVNRTSLRHALTALETMGVVTRRVGDGTYFTNDAATILSAPLDFLILVDGIPFRDLIEARTIVEPELAARAAERATSEDLAGLRSALKDMQASGPDRARLAQADVAFHETIFRASGNRTCLYMFSALHRALIAGISRTSVFDDASETIGYHKGIYQAIYRRQPEQARRQMREHLKATERMVLDAYEKARQLQASKITVESLEAGDTWRVRPAGADRSGGSWMRNP